MLSRRCSIGATNHRDVESEIFRQTSVSEMTKAWEGTNAQLKERTEEAKMAAHYGSRLLQKIDALESEVAALRGQKSTAVQASVQQCLFSRAIRTNMTYESPSPPPLMFLYFCIFFPSSALSCCSNMCILCAMLVLSSRRVRSLKIFGTKWSSFRRPTQQSWPSVKNRWTACRKS